MTMYNTEFIEEKKRLHDTVTFMQEEIDAMKHQREHVWENTSSAQVAEHINNILYNKIKDYKRNIGSPYFARVDFYPDDANKEVLYIGRTSVMDDAEHIVIDWRAPISSLYYDGRLGRSSYVCPDGKITGNISLKRQYKIADSELESFVDIDIASTDELLQQSLSEASDARLKNIIATIQAEQNEVIRKELNRSIIVQGVAGSGKTTVALHRISYLLYTYSKVLETDKVLILAPNHFFLDYISETLPDLGVENIIQKTYEDFAVQLLKLKYSVVSSNVDLKRVISNDNIDGIKQIMGFKSSMRFKEIVDAYVRDFERTLFDKVKGDFSVDGVRILSREAFKDIFESLSSKKSFAERLNILKERVTEHLKRICDAYESGNITDVGNITGDVYAEIKKNGIKLLTKYMSQIQLKDVVSHYKRMIDRNTFFNDVLSPSQYKEMKVTFIERLKEKKISFEDLPALLFLYYRIWGIKKEDILKYIVIDEAQDLGSFHFYVLKKMFQTNNITILGDIAQGIYSYRGIMDWNEVNKEVFDGTAEIINLTQSYRTTVEVIEEANKVADKMKSQLGIELANAVIRHGEKVHYHCVDYNFLYDEIISRITQCQENGHQNIAIITKDDIEAKRVFECLSHLVSGIHLIDDDTKNYFPGITVLTAYSSKGLEFDAVILLSVDEERYSNNIIDGKLLYVAMTRAMHSLDIYYQGKLTNWLT